MKTRFATRWLAVGWLWAALAAAQVTPDWKGQVHECVAAGKLGAALAIAEARLAAAPDDWEAHGWRARLLAWSGRRPEAEAEYRRVLGVFPEDVDILLGLADVLAWEQRPGEALDLLDRAQTLAPSRPEIYVRRGRILGTLARPEQARESFRRALELDPANAEAKAGLARFAPDARHELRIGSDTDFFNFAETAQATTLSLHSRVSSRWATYLAGSFHHRFSQDAGRFATSVTYRLSSADAFTMGGAAARDQGVIPRAEAFLEYDRGFKLSREGPVRGLELTYQQRWLWFQNARILAANPGFHFYLPRDWIWSFRLTVARSRFSTAPGDWQLSGATRLSFPMHRRVTAHVLYGVGTEDFIFADQIGRFSARTFGTGLKCVLGKRQEFTAAAFYQDRSQGRSQTSLGFSYAIRF